MNKFEQRRENHFLLLYSLLIRFSLGFLQLILRLYYSTSSQEISLEPTLIGGHSFVISFSRIQFFTPRNYFRVALCILGGLMKKSHCREICVRPATGTNQWEESAQGNKINPGVAAR
ncbi:MAG: hypothetical protein WAK20_04755 [Candidatus Acidiferrum sp.]